MAFIAIHSICTVNRKKKKNSIQTCIGFVHMCANTVHQNLKTFATFIDSNGVWAVLIAIYCTNIK